MYKRFFLKLVLDCHAVDEWKTAAKHLSHNRPEPADAGDSDLRLATVGDADVQAAIQLQVILESLGHLMAGDRNRFFMAPHLGYRVIGA